jgi:hypothetical protein
MNSKILILSSTLASALLFGNCVAQEFPEGYWSLEQATEVLEKTRTVVLDPDISSLTEAEKSVAGKLIRVGEIFNRIYENSLHPQALGSLQNLKLLHKGEEHTAALLDIYYRSGGPITTTLDNKRVAFLPVDPEKPGKNVYPPELTNSQMDPFLEARPELAADLLNVRTVVRASTEENIRLDLLVLDRFPVLDDMHHGLRDRLKALRTGKDDAPWYALPYSVRWAPDIMQAYRLLLSAAVRKAMNCHLPWEDYRTFRTVCRLVQDAKYKVISPWESITSSPISVSHAVQIPPPFCLTTQTTHESTVALFYCVITS